MASPQRALATLIHRSLVRSPDRLPDDGLQYELLDGLLRVTPAPVLAHQRAVGNLHLLLRAGCSPGR